MTDYDIIVVGAGPIGSTYAYHMANMGYKVALYDLRGRIGEPLQCAGLVSTNINDICTIPEEIIFNKVKGAHLISSDNTCITVEKDKEAAYVLDRVYYDKYLFQKAVDAGVQAHLNTRVLDVDIENNMIKTADSTVSAKLIAVACGPTSSTSRKMNPDLEDEHFLAIQYTVQSDNINTDYVSLEVHEEILPGFLWKIPVSPTIQRVGLFTNLSYQQASTILNNSLKSTDTVLERHSGSIPKYNKDKKIVKNNTILIGDCASQIKPTTGGGLITGLTMAKLASIKSDLALKENDNKYLMEYEKEYHQRYNNEFKAQQNVQKIMTDCTADDFNYMFKQLKENQVDKMISEYGDMDTQTPLLKQLVKTGVIFKLIPKIGVRRLKNIWKSL